MKVFLVFAAVLSIGFFSCKKKDPEPKRRASTKAVTQQTNVPALVTDTVAITSR